MCLWILILFCVMCLLCEWRFRLEITHSIERARELCGMVLNIYILYGYVNMHRCISIVKGWCDPKKMRHKKGEKLETTKNETKPNQKKRDRNGSEATKKWCGTKRNGKVKVVLGEKRVRFFIETRRSLPYLLSLCFAFDTSSFRMNVRSTFNELLGKF